MSKIHLIEKYDLMRPLGPNSDEWGSGYWSKISPKKALTLSKECGSIYFHRSQSVPSHDGGIITGYRIADQADQERINRWNREHGGRIKKKIIGRYVFIYRPSLDHKDIPSGPGGWSQEQKFVPCPQSTKLTKLSALKALKDRIHAIAALTPVEPWFYPSAPPVQGFYGTDPLILVGYRPSQYNEWKPSDPGRKRLYESLAELGAGNAHLTDLYKYREDSKDALPLDWLPDFGIHLEWLQEEIDILKPICIVAMGDKTYDLLKKYLPGEYVAKVRHFALWPQYVPRYRGSMEAVLNPAYQCLRDDRRI